VPLTPARPAPWPRALDQEAAAIQAALAAQVVERDEPQPPRLIVALDLGFRRAEGEERARAAAVVVSFPDLAIVERRVVEETVRFPYVPGFLAFREAPAMLAVLAALDTTPDLILIDGQGRLHPRRCGIACHVGVLVDRPTIGCAKALLLRLTAPPLGPAPGERVPLMQGGERLGLALRTRRAAQPVYVSVGHRVTLDRAADLVWQTCRGYRLPEPLRQAHLLASGHVPPPVAEPPSGQLSLWSDALGSERNG
jgi:deoxyribonuclease V